MNLYAKYGLTWSLCGHDSQARKPAVSMLASPNKAIMPTSPCKAVLLSLYEIGY